MVGPLVGWELTRLSRRGTAHVWRAAYALALLVALGLCYTDWSGDAARFAEAFAGTFFYCQFAAVLLVVPAYVGGMMAEERERGTLDLLRASGLSDREIVLGKLAARLVHVAGILLTGYPVLAAIALAGGVSPGRVLAETAGAGLTLVLVGAGAAFRAAGAPDGRSAVGRAYWTVSGLGLAGLYAALTGTPLRGATPFGAFAEFSLDRYAVGRVSYATALAEAVAAYALFVLVTAVFVVVGAVRGLRAADEGRTAARPATERTRPDLPEIGDDPLRWRERYMVRAGWDRVGPRLAAANDRVFDWLSDWGGPVVLMTGLPLLGMCCFSGTLIAYSTDQEVATAVRVPVVGGLVVLAGLIGLWSAGGVAGERRRRTLDDVLALPVDRVEILWAKRAGVWDKALPLVGLVLLVAAGMVLLGALHPLAGAMLAMTAVIHVAFFGALGLWLSVVCRTDRRAMLAFAGLALAGAVLREAVLDLGCWPATWWRLACDWHTIGRVPNWWLAELTADWFASAAAAWLLWRDAVRRFEREGT